MKKFETGTTYTMHFIGDHNLTVDYTVTNRTSSTVTITDGQETKTCRINKKYSEYRGTETIFPCGRYSMAPMLSA